MNITDPIADFLTRIRNASAVKQEVVTVPASMMKISIANILKEEGFIRNYKCVRSNQQGVLKVALKYSEDGRSVIQNIKRVSKPSLRVYVPTGKIPKVRSGFGISILSTSKGVITGAKAKALKVGGEYICSVY